MASLILGPLQRYAGETEATVWVETSEPCEVEVLGAREPTFSVEGHHFALVHCTGLEPASTTPYEVRLDGRRVWPEDGSPFPPSVVRTHGHDGPLRLAWGSCRVCAPDVPPYSLRKDEDPRGREVDALRVLADHMTRRARGRLAARARAARRPGLRRRGVARRGEFIRSRRDPDGAAGRDLVGVHLVPEHHQTVQTRRRGGAGHVVGQHAQRVDLAAARVLVLAEGVGREVGAHTRHEPHAMPPGASWPGVRTTLGGNPVPSRATPADVEPHLVRRGGGRLEPGACTSA